VLLYEKDPLQSSKRLISRQESQLHPLRKHIAEGVHERQQSLPVSLGLAEYCRPKEIVIRGLLASRAEPLEMTTRDPLAVFPQVDDKQLRQVPAGRDDALRRVLQEIGAP